MASNKDFNPDRDLVYLQVTYPKKRDLIGPYLITEHGLDAARKRLLNLCKLNIEGMNDILLAKIGDEINPSGFIFQALKKRRTIAGDQNREGFGVSSLLSASSEVVEKIRECEEKGEKADLYTVYSCSMHKKELMDWQECFTPCKKAEDMLIWPCKQGSNGVETRLSSIGAQTGSLLTACDEMRELSQAVPDIEKWLNDYTSMRQVLIVLRVVANDAEGQLGMFVGGASQMTIPLSQQSCVIRK